MAKLIFINRVCWPSEEATSLILMDLVRHLAARGWECHIIAATPGAESHSDDSGATIRFHRSDSETQPRKLGLLPKALAYWRFTRHAERIAKSIVDPGDHLIVLTDPPLLGVAMARIAGKREAAVWHWVQDIYPEVAMALISNPVLRWSLSRLKRRRNHAWTGARGIVTIGRDMAGLIKSQIGPNIPIHIVPNWATYRPSENTSTSSLPPEFLPNCEILVMYSGNLGRAHILSPLLEMARQLRNIPSIHFLIVGSGAQKEPLMKAASAAKLDNISFRPPVPLDQVSDLLHAANIQMITMRPSCSGTVLPSKFYGVMAAHRPVIFIGPATSEMAHWVDKNGLGKACTPENVAPAVNYLRDFTNSAQLPLEAKTNVARFAQELQGPDDAAERWEELLRQSISPPSV